MEQEFETQVLDIDKEKIIKKLRSLGAAEEPEVMQKRFIYDLKPCNESSEGKWVRLRQVENKKPTMTYKNKSGSGKSQTEEIEVEVEDFEKCAVLLSKLPFQKIFYQENKRWRFELNGVEFDFDSWPGIPTYLEIEAENEDKIEEALEMLDLKGKDAGHLGIMTIYKKYGIDLHSMKELKFN